jgi:Protein of unknown function, DUF600
VNPFERQTEILNHLVQIMHDESDKNYEKSTCYFELNIIEGWSETRFSFTQRGLEISRPISEEFTWEIHSLLEELHAAMKAHTGGEWKSFTLTLDKGGKAHTKFYYPEANAE